MGWSCSRNTTRITDGQPLLLPDLCLDLVFDSEEKSVFKEK